MEKKLNKKIDRIGVFFGGKSSEHEISLLSAKTVINAIDEEKHKVIPIGITREGKWKILDGDFGDIADGKWEEKSRPISVNEACEGIDFAFPILHGPFGEDGRIQGLLVTNRESTVGIPFCLKISFANALSIQRAELMTPLPA